ncbi:hypothetical protein LB507_001118 [Fusarium sp. FIESC RH6]|nr:hypothetical protein LB507_001118 [Fusarium sp. FIESC RH6]
MKRKRGTIFIKSEDEDTEKVWIQQPEDYESSTPTMGYMDMATHTGEMRSVISLCSFSLYPSYLFFTSLNDELLSNTAIWAFTYGVPLPESVKPLGFHSSISMVAW